jgi:hypothetical protein
MKADEKERQAGTYRFGLFLASCAWQTEKKAPFGEHPSIRLESTIWDL